MCVWKSGVLTALRVEDPLLTGPSNSRLVTSLRKFQGRIRTSFLYILGSLSLKLGNCARLRKILCYFL